MNPAIVGIVQNRDEEVERLQAELQTTRLLCRQLAEEVAALREAGGSRGLSEKGGKGPSGAATGALIEASTVLPAPRAAGIIRGEDDTITG
jgi:hypothetical protein